MRIAVTGGNGLVGSRLCRILADKGHTVLGLGRGPRTAAGSFDWATVDLTDEQGVERAFASSGAAPPEVIVHVAAMTEVDRCEKDPDEAYRSNVVASAVIAREARRHQAHVINVSTDYVFDGAAGPYDEEAIPNPQGVYALTKHMGEQATRALAPSWAIARTAVVYGYPPSSHGNFGTWLVEALSRGQPVRLFEDQYVSPSLATNVAEQLAELAERKLPGVWNLCGAEVVNRVAFGQALCAAFGFDASHLVPSKMKDVPLSASRPARSGLKTDKAMRELSVKPLGLDESLKRFKAEWDAFRASP